MLRRSRKAFRRNKSSGKATPANNTVAANDTTKKKVPASNIAIVVTNDYEGRKKKREHGPDDIDPSAVVACDEEPSQLPQKYFDNRVLHPSWVVNTPYGVGTVEACRTVVPGESDEEKGDGETLYEVEKESLGDHKYYIRLACDSDSVSPCSRLVTNKTYPSVEPEIGSDVVLTCFYSARNSTPQRGRVVKLRPDARQAVVRLVTWRLVRQTPPVTVTTTLKRGQRVGAPTKAPIRRQYPTVSFVTCYLGYDSIQVVSPKSVNDMNACETLLYVYERQHLAYELYVARQYETCCDLYESAITAIGRLLFDKQLLEAQTVRGNLILTQIRCRNQAAICCLHMSNHQGVIEHAMRALKMLRALEKKREVSHEVGSVTSSSCLSSESDPGPDRQEKRELNRICGEMRVFGVWRIKSMQLLTLALVRFCQWEHAKEICLQAHKIIVKYTTQSPPTASSSRRAAFQDYLHRRSQLLHVDKSLLRLYARIEQQRGGRMNLTDRSIVVVDQERADGEDEVSTLDDIDPEWLDEDEEKDMAKDWQPLAAVVAQLPNEGNILLPQPQKEDYDSVLSEASCDLSYGAAAGLGLGTKCLTRVTEVGTLDRRVVVPGDGAAGEVPLTPLDSTPSVHESRQAFATVMTSDSDDSLYEGTAKVSPAEVDVKVVDPHTSRAPDRIEGNLSNSRDWDEVDLDAVVQTEGGLDAIQFSSAVAIQALIRGVLARRAFWAIHMELSIAAGTIQAWFRSVYHRRTLQRELLVAINAAIALQSLHRAHRIRCRYLQLKGAVCAIQHFTRASLARRRSLLRTLASVALQARFRGRIERRDYLRQRGGAIRVQAFLRSALARRSFNNNLRELKSAVAIIESRYLESVRRQAQRRYLSSASAAATKVQSLFRRHSELQRYRRQIDSAVCLQSLSRVLIAKRRLKETKEASLPACTLIQAWHRRIRSRKEFLKKRDASILVQAVARGCRDRRVYHHQRHQAITGCVVIQAWYRSLFQRASVTEYKLATRAAALTMQHFFRSFQTRQRYIRLKASAVIAQTLCRAHLARNYVQQRKVMMSRACCKIQAWYRSITQRHDYNRKLTTEARSQFNQSRASMATAAGTIQAAFRSSLESSKRRNQLCKIVLCQATSRGWLARRSVEQMKLRQFAIRIQSSSLRRLAQTRALELKANATAAATRIQTFYRSSKRRRQYKRLQKGIRFIQAKFRVCEAIRRRNESRTGTRASNQASARDTRIVSLHRGVSERQTFGNVKTATLPPSPELSAATLRVASTHRSKPLPMHGVAQAPDCLKDHSAHASLESVMSSAGDMPRNRIQVAVDRTPRMACEVKAKLNANDAISDNDAMSQATSQFYETASHASDVSDVASLNSGRFSLMSAPVQTSRSSRPKGLRPGARKAFVDPEALRRLKTRAEEKNASKTLISPSTPTTTSRRSSPGAATDVDETSVMSDDASQITSASEYFDAASHVSGGDASDAGDSFRSGYSRASAASGYSRFSVVSAPAFVRSEVGKVRDKHGNVTSTRKVFVDSATLKKLQRRSRPAPPSSSASTSSNRRKPFIAPSLLEELTEGGSMTSVREQGRFEPVYEEPPDDNWRDEIKVFAPSAKKKVHGSKSVDARRGRARDRDRPASSGASAGGASVGGSSANRRVSFARDVVFSEDFKSVDDGCGSDNNNKDNNDPRADDSAANHDELRPPRRRAWYQPGEFQAGVGTLVASGASIGSLIASKFMKGR